MAEIDLDAFYAAYRQDGRSRPAYDPSLMVVLVLTVIDAAEDELYGEARGDELPPQLATGQGRKKWLSEASVALQRADQARPMVRSRPGRSKESKRRGVDCIVR